MERGWLRVAVVLSGTQARQTGHVFYGPGATKTDLPELNSYQKECLREAKKYSVEQNVKIAAVKQTIVHQQQVCCYCSKISFVIWFW